MSKEHIELPDVTIEKLLKNEYQMNSVGNDDITIPVVEPKKVDNVTDSSDEIEKIENEEEKKSKKSKVKYNDIEFPSRGFNSLEEAIDFMEKPYFKGLGKADKDEYIKWLIK